MATEDTMMNPPIEGLMDRTQSKFALVTLSARRAREINSYFNQLGEGLGSMVPPQVSSTSRKPLSISFEEIAADKIKSVAMAVYDDVEADLDADLDADVLDEAAAEVAAVFGGSPVVQNAHNEVVTDEVVTDEVVAKAPAETAGE